jgi:molecular chaperone GrpE
VSEQSPEEPRIVVTDRRKIDPETGAVRDESGAGARPAPGGPSTRLGGRAAPGPRPAGQAAPGAPTGRHASSAAEDFDIPEKTATERALEKQLAERTADLQRVTAEYANYRKRVDRDRTVVVETATGAVLAALLPVLDDIDRARQHGDLTGAFKAVADQLEATLEKLGLQPFGAEGDRFDPTVHEAVAHEVSADVSVPTAVAVLRRGYRQGERLLRAPLVAVAEPAPPAEPTAEEAEPGLEWLGDDQPAT